MHRGRLCKLETCVILKENLKCFRNEVCCQDTSFLTRSNSDSSTTTDFIDLTQKFWINRWNIHDLMNLGLYRSFKHQSELHFSVNDQLAKRNIWIIFSLHTLTKYQFIHNSLQHEYSIYHVKTFIHSCFAPKKKIHSNVLFQFVSILQECFTLEYTHKKLVLLSPTTNNKIHHI